MSSIFRSKSLESTHLWTSALAEHIERYLLIIDKGCKIDTKHIKETGDALGSITLSFYQTIQVS